MIDTKLADALINHRALWMEISELCLDELENEHYSSADDIKYDAIINLGYVEGNINLDCFCCNYTGFNGEDARNREYSKCKYCPVDWEIDWEENLSCPPCCLSLFDDFDCAVCDGDFEEAYKIAYEIANLTINPIYIEEEDLLYH